mmetsp:Transcript_67708/g.181072  ORF Transcript_67708/g.181072 Transcript_67708/m.181072 type:complete len:279 (+) Transcript_67708:249-1085(+)
MDSCSATSGPGCLARMFLSSTYSFSFSWMRRSFSTTSSVLAMRRFCSVWIFWIISSWLGSDPSSLRHRCTFIGFSSSSDSAFTLVLSDSNSRCRWYTSLRSTSKLAVCCLSMASLRLRSPILSRSIRMSSSRSRYCTSPLLSVDCWILIFSYSSASSSLRRISCVPRMSLSLITWSYSFLSAARSWSASVMMWLSLLISLAWPEMVSSPSRTFFLSSLSSFLRLSSSRSTRLCSKCSLTSAVSLAVISSLSCSIWWFMILNLRFISSISSCASMRFLL